LARSAFHQLLKSLLLVHLKLELLDLGIAVLVLLINLRLLEHHLLRAGGRLAQLREQLRALGGHLLLPGGHEQCAHVPKRVEHHLSAHLL
jgi:hypothetical protein